MRFALNLKPMTTLSPSSWSCCALLLIFFFASFFFLDLDLFFLLPSPSASEDSAEDRSEEEGEGVGGGAPSRPGSPATICSHASERLILIRSLLGRLRSWRVREWREERKKGNGV